MTNDNGLFFLEHLAAFSDTLIISSIGTAYYKQAVKLNIGESMDMGTIYLTRNITRLQTVEITGRLENSYKSDYSFIWCQN